MENKMTCPKCGQPLPNDSAFCQYCGVNIEEERTRIADQEAALKAKAEQEAMAKKDLRRGGVLCPKCGQPLPADSMFCQFCGETLKADPPTEPDIRAAKAKNPLMLTTICLAVFAALLVGLCIYQFISNKTTADRAIELEQKVSALQADVTSKDSTISNMKKKEQEAEVATNLYKTICTEAASGSFGYGSDNFHSSTGIIVLNPGSTKSFNLTANWPNGGLVDWTYSGSSAYITLDEDEWYTYTTATVHARITGVTKVTFTNNVDSREFSMLIIVK